jgi:hypothetical protein
MGINAIDGLVPIGRTCRYQLYAGGKMLRVALLTFLASGSYALAMELDVMELASNLGTVLAGGEKCGYSFDNDAVIAFVREHVPADALGFASMLNTMTIGAGAQLDNLSDTAFIAHCAVVEQTARHYGFMN